MAAATDPSHPAAGALPTVLVIDDDAAIRSLLRRLLERAGYQVAEAHSGRTGLALVREGLSVQLLVADLKMSDGSGGWLLAQLAYEYPALLPRTVVMSGDAHGAKAAHLAVRWRCPVISKALLDDQLLPTLRRLSGSQAEVA